MELKQLLRARKVVPGTMVVLVAATVLHGWWSWSDIDNLLWGPPVGGGLALAVGSVYGTFRIRERLTGFSWDEPVREHINERLITMIRAEGRGLAEEEQHFLQADRRLLSLFYHFVDNDRSLTEKAHRVRNNGIVATSVVDAGLIAFGGYMAHVIAALVTGRFENVAWGLFYFCTWILSFALFFPLAIKRHVELSNDQINFIETHYRPAVRERAESILLNMPR